MKVLLKLNLVILTFILLVPTPSFSQSKSSGEIINVNHQLRIAFTDLGDRMLNPGDVVKIYNNGNFIAHLKVVETSEVVSKLAIIDEGQYQATFGDFTSINIGDMVTKISQGEEAAFKETEVIKPRDSVLREDDINLSNKLNDLMQEKKIQDERIAQMNSELTRVTNELIQIKDELVKKSGELNLSKSELIDKKNELDKISKEADILRKDNQALNEKINKMSPDLFIAAQEKEEYERKVNILERKLLLLKEKLEKMEKLMEGI